MNIAGIVKDDYVNGPGIRLSLYVSGCTHHCPGCFQSETWDFNFGKLYTIDTKNDIIRELRKDYYSGLTLLGGDPMEIPNQIYLCSLISTIKREFRESRTIWVYTGYYYEDFLKDGKQYIDPYTKFIMKDIDIMVDGPFEQDKKDLTLKFKGSSNQRIINVQKSMEKNQIVLDPLND